MKRNWKTELGDTWEFCFGIDNLAKPSQTVFTCNCLLVSHSSCMQMCLIFNFPFSEEEYLRKILFMFILIQTSEDD